MLKAILESLDGVPEAQQPLYAEADGKFVLQVEGIDSHPAVVGLRNGHANSKRERDEFKAKLREAEERLKSLPEDFDPDEFERLKAEAEARAADPDNKDHRAEIERAVNATKKEWETKLAREKSKWESDLEAEREARTRLDGQLRTTRKSDALTKALQEVNVKGPLFEAALALHDRNVEVVDEDGEYIPKVKADLGGDDVATYIRNWAQTDQGKAFIDPARGGDAPGSRAGHGGPRNGKAGDMGGDRKERVAALASKFPELSNG